tara:strand:- start:8017 stop:8208 length:192 start_codon:yes stop_codon:yes gene_type:complete
MLQDNQIIYMINIKEVSTLDVYDEEFQILFYTVLEKFVNEFDDMAQMNTIQKAKELLDTINDQ